VTLPDDLCAGEPVTIRRPGHPRLRRPNGSASRLASSPSCATTDL